MWRRKKFLIKGKKKLPKQIPLHILDLGMEQDSGIEEVLEMPRC